MHNIYTDLAVSLTTALIIAVTITAILRMTIHIRRHIKEQQAPKHRQAPSNLPVLHNYGNPCARGCAVCN